MAKQVKTPFGTFASMAEAGRYINNAGFAQTVKAAYPIATFREAGTFVPAQAWVEGIGMTQEEHDTIDLVRDLCNGAVAGWSIL